MPLNARASTSTRNTSANDDEHIRLTMAELAVALEQCIEMRQNAIVHGGTGVGKTSVFGQVAARTLHTMDAFKTMYRESTDYTGVPWLVKNEQDGEMETAWAAPSMIRRLRKAAADADANNRPHLILWDELNRVENINMLNVAAQAMHESNFGDHYIPNLLHFACVNDVGESTGTTQLPEHLRNRNIHLYVAADAETWMMWARAGNLLGPGAPNVIAYVHNHPDHVYLPDRKADAFPTPRAWEFLSKVLNPKLPERVEDSLIYGAIGPAVGQQFRADLDLQRNLASRYSIVRILQSPATEPVPQEVSAQYAIAAALSTYMTPANANNAVTYLNRMTSEMQTFSILGALRRNTPKGKTFEACPLFESLMFSKWIGNNASAL